MSTSAERSPWAWVPSLYFTQGVPYVSVMTLAVVMYKNLGVGNAEIALATSWLYLPWVVKPLWSPLVDLLGRKRHWIVALQFAVGAALAMVALVLPGPRWFALTLALFWLMAFASATHDIAADGFYMLALPDERRQAAYVGVRSTFYRLAMIAGQGGLVVLAGMLYEHRGPAAAISTVPAVASATMATSEMTSWATAWASVMALLSALFFAAALYHAWALPRPGGDRAAPRGARGPLQPARRHRDRGALRVGAEKTLPRRLRPAAAVTGSPPRAPAFCGCTTACPDRSPPPRGRRPGARICRSRCPPGPPAPGRGSCRC